MPGFVRYRPSARAQILQQLGSGVAAGLHRARDHVRRDLASGWLPGLLEQVRAGLARVSDREPADAIAAIELALTEPARLAGRPLHELAERDADGNVLPLVASAQPTKVRILHLPPPPDQPVSVGGVSRLLQQDPLPPVRGAGYPDSPRRASSCRQATPSVKPGPRSGRSAQSSSGMSTSRPPAAAT